MSLILMPFVFLQIYTQRASSIPSSETTSINDFDDDDDEDEDEDDVADGKKIFSFCCV